MSRLMTVLPVGILALGLGACAQPTEAPAPAEPVAVEQAPTPLPPTEAVVEKAEPIEEDAEFASIEFVLPDGTTQTLGDMDMMDKVNLVRDEGFIARGDWDADGDEDVAILMANAIEEGQPVLFVAALENVDGALVNVGMYALDPGSDVQDVRIEDGQLVIDVIRPTSDGTGYEVVSVAFEPVTGQLGEPTTSEPAPAPTAAPTEAPPPAPPSVTFSVKPSDTTAPESIDIFVHAFDNPAITRLELHRNGEVWQEWDSPDANGVPYVHHTFVWAASTAGTYRLQVIARDKWGGEGWTEEKVLSVAEQQ